MKNLEGDSSTENPILKDLRVYTELSKSGLIEVEDGFLIFFISEGPESLNNQNTQNVLNGPRNLGFIKVSKDLESILSLGSEQRGGYFNLNG